MDLASLLSDRPALLWIDRFHRRNNAVWGRWLRAELPRLGHRLLSRAANVRAQFGPFKVFGLSNLDVPDMLAGTFENAFGIGQRRAIVEAEIRSLGVNRNVKDSVAKSLACAIADGDGAVRVVDIFVAGSYFIEQQRPKFESEIASRFVVRLQEFQKLAGRRIFHGAGF